jgi:hypothetical protein
METFTMDYTRTLRFQQASEETEVQPDAGTMDTQHPAPIHKLPKQKVQCFRVLTFFIHFIPTAHTRKFDTLFPFLSFLYLKPL